MAVVRERLEEQTALKVLTKYNFTASVEHPSKSTSLAKCLHEALRSYYTAGWYSCKSRRVLTWRPDPPVSC